MLIEDARLKLTIWYVLVIMFVSFSFSAFLYNGLLSSTSRALENYERRLERRYQMERVNLRMPGPGPFFDSQTISEVREKALFDLVAVNIFILISSSSLGYFLAGRTLKPIEIMIEKQKRFISDAAHEMKTPLTIMKTDMEVGVRDKKLSINQAKEIMNFQVVEIDRLTNLVNHMLDKTRYQNNHIMPKKDIVNLEEMAQNIENKFVQLISQKNINIYKNLYVSEIIFDRDDFQIVLSNLFENAIKYNKEKGDVHIDSYSDKSSTYVKVSDTGVGIQKKEIEKIFDAFYRIEKSRSSSIENGYGLGLAIVKEIVEKNKSKIYVESELGKGTSFIIKIPKI